MKRLLSKLFKLILILGIVGASVAYYIVYWGNTSEREDEYFFIRSDDTYEIVHENLISQGIIENEWSFNLLANAMNLKNMWKPGKYKIEGGISNVKLIRMIRSGKWEKVVLKLKPETSRDSLITYLSEVLQAEKSDFETLLASDWVSENGFTQENIWCIFLPDHYFANWATPANKVLERFLKEYRKFWTAERIQKAEDLNLNPEKAAILATIVDGEAIHVSEMPRIAGLYLNRLQKGIRLQADPTVLFVVGREGRRRVLYSDLKAEDAYNTYVYSGLPPGPIFLPDKRAINAVLNPEKHNYIFMCAKPDGSYFHNFTASGLQHQRNARAYQRYLSQQGIKR